MASCGSKVISKEEADNMPSASELLQKEAERRRLEDQTHESKIDKTTSNSE